MMLVEIEGKQLDIMCQVVVILLNVGIFRKVFQCGIEEFKKEFIFVLNFVRFLVVFFQLFWYLLDFFVRLIMLNWWIEKVIFIYVMYIMKCESCF